MSPIRAGTLSALHPLAGASDILRGILLMCVGVCAFPFMKTGF